MEKALKVSLALVLALGLCSCSIFSEGDPVDPKQGIVGKWQDDADPENILIFKADGTALEPARLLLDELKARSKQ